MLTVSLATARDVERAFGVASDGRRQRRRRARFRRVAADRAARWRARLADRRGDGPVVLAVGGVEERKNTLRLLRAFARLRGALPAARLWILGGATVLDHGVYRAAFERALRALPADARAAVVELGVVRRGRRAGAVPAGRRAGAAVAARRVRTGRAGGAGGRAAAGRVARARRSPNTWTRPAPRWSTRCPRQRSPPGLQRGAGRAPGAPRGRARGAPRHTPGGVVAGAAVVHRHTKGPSLMPEMHFPFAGLTATRCAAIHRRWSCATTWRSAAPTRCRLHRAQPHDAPHRLRAGARQVRLRLLGARSISWRDRGARRRLRAASRSR